MLRPNFNVSKASATTSTTNTTTISEGTFSQRNIRLAGEPESNGGKSLAPAFLQSVSDSSPKIGPGSITPAEVSLSTSATAHVTDGNEHEKNDLLGLFEKYDIGAVETDVDLLDEKMKQFKGRQSLVTSSAFAAEVKEKEIKGYDHEHKEGLPPSIVEKKDGKMQPNEVIVIDQSYNPPKEEDVKLQSDDLNPKETIESPTDVQESTADIVDQTTSAPIQSMGMQPYNPDDTTQTSPLVDSGESKVTSSSDQAPKPTRPNTKRKGSLGRTSGFVNPQEQHQQSHKPFDFNIFLSQLKHKSAEPIVKYTKSFLASFTRQAPQMNSEQIVKAINDFKLFIDGKFAEYEPFASMDEKELENSREGIEKLVMNCLYELCFSPAAVKKHGQNAANFMRDDVSDDLTFELQIEKFNWVLGVHLDVDLDQLLAQKRSNSKDKIDYLEHAREQLNKINDYRAPRDKIICILNSCKVIFSLLKVTNNETNADSFIPLLILVIMKAKAPNFISNIRYILRFRGSKWLNHGETSYYLSTIEAAVNFIQDIKQEDLTIDESHFYAHVEAWEADQKQKNAHLAQPIPKHPTNSELQTNQSMSPSNVLLASAGMIGKSLSNFLSLTPSSETSEGPPQISTGLTEAQIDEAFSQLSEIFSALDKGILRDVIVMNDGDIERSLEACLQLVNDE